MRQALDSEEARAAHNARPQRRQDAAHSSPRVARVASLSAASLARRVLLLDRHPVLDLRPVWQRLYVGPGAVTEPVRALCCARPQRPSRRRSRAPAGVGCDGSAAVPPCGWPGGARLLEREAHPGRATRGSSPPCGPRWGEYLPAFLLPPRDGVLPRSKAGSIPDSLPGPERLRMASCSPTRNGSCSTRSISADTKCRR